MNRNTGYWIAVYFIFICLFLDISAFATTITIYDNYRGGTPTARCFRQDIVGRDEFFSVTKMTINLNPGEGIYIDIYSRYLDNIGKYYTELGDLFISTDGWHPKGEAPYFSDSYLLGGEDWEFVLVMDDHLPDPFSGQLSGQFGLYPVLNSRIILSSAPYGYVYREGQEVHYNTQGLNPLATGSWSIGNWGGSDEDDYLRFALSYSGPIRFKELGFHWGMTCGNDVIEGVATIPEPTTLLLLVSGILGFGLMRSYRKNRS